MLQPDYTIVRHLQCCSAAVSPAVDTMLSGVNLGDVKAVRESVQQYYGEVGVADMISATIIGVKSFKQTI